MSKLTPEELQSVNDLQSKYNQTIFEIGAAEAQIIVFQQQQEWQEILALKHLWFQMQRLHSIKRALMVNFFLQN